MRQTHDAYDVLGDNPDEDDHIRRRDLPCACASGSRKFDYSRCALSEMLGIYEDYTIRYIDNENTSSKHARGRLLAHIEGSLARSRRATSSPRA